MKNGLLVVFLLAMILALAVPLAVNFYNSEEAFTPDNLIRIQIIANSDEQGDQLVKYQLKDEIIKFLKPQLANAKDVNESILIINENINEIQEITEEVLEVSNKKYLYQLAFMDIEFPTKSYGDLVLPQAEYKALRVVLGKGEGQNWWCVLFPPLCFLNEDITISEESYDKPPIYIKERLQDLQLPRITSKD